MSDLPHLDADGKAHMVSISQKPSSVRKAIAEGFVKLSTETLEKIKNNQIKKGDALSVARIAGIAAAKKTPDLLPLAHPIAITHISVELTVQTNGIRIETSVETVGSTGVEMEALTSVSVAALNIYDMVKSYERGASIEYIQLLHKSGGTKGDYTREPGTNNA